ncbi:MAG: hypothetical protein ACK541_10715 [Burkholderiales bacterium]
MTHTVEINLIKTGKDAPSMTSDVAEETEVIRPVVDWKERCFF